MINITKYEKENLLNPKAFEMFVYAIFEEKGYSIKHRKKPRSNAMVLELESINFKEKELFICEIKYSSVIESPYKIRSSIEYLKNVLKDNERGLIIINSLCTLEERELAIKDNINIIDLSNILYIIKDDKELYQSFLNLLNFSVSDIPLTKPEILFFTDYTEYDAPPEPNWKKIFSEIKSGREYFQEYETACTEALKLIFFDYLSIWKIQQKSNDDLYRFDLICKIKNDIRDDFFTTITNFFNTKYIVFEFKNYQGKITQKEIYTTEKYLYDKALRKVAIIISRKGLDTNAKKAIKGSLREQGKLIISLTDSDLIKMLEKNKNNENPSDYLALKLDDLLIELEK